MLSAVIATLTFNPWGRYWTLHFAIWLLDTAGNGGWDHSKHRGWISADVLHSHVSGWRRAHMVSIVAALRWRFDPPFQVSESSPHHVESNWGHPGAARGKLEPNFPVFFFLASKSEREFPCEAARSENEAKNALPCFQLATQLLGLRRAGSCT